MGLFAGALARPRWIARHLLNAGEAARGTAYVAGTPHASSVQSESAPAPAPGPLRTYFEGNVEGPGIYKWTHYFEIYERHFARFRGKAVHVAEVGVYSGGSLRMWKWYREYI